MNTKCNLRLNAVGVAFAAALMSLPAVSGLAAGGPGGGGGSGGGGGGGGGGSFAFAVPPLYFVDSDVPSDVLPVDRLSAQGLFICASLTGSHATPVDTVVTINGVSLVHASGLAPCYFKLDPAGPMPTIGADRLLHVRVSSVSAKTSRQVDAQCPARVEVTSSPAPGASLAGVPTLQMTWGNLPPNFAVNGSAFQGVGLMAVDPTTGASANLPTAPSVITVTDATLTVAPIPATQIYQSFLQYVGVTSAVFGAGAPEAWATCGLSRRTAYAN